MLFEQHNAEFEKKVGYSWAQGTFARYRTVCKHIREFLPFTYRREDIPLKELSLTFINDFEYFLREEKKCRTNTVWGYMKASKDSDRLRLTINGTNIIDWFKQKYQKVKQATSYYKRPIIKPEEGESKGIKR